ncbi:hypothetical protein QAD02_005101 [Eretmocerus hayati]|uniref:Uncharacterized protein n=1 Tax=Eretmocerus hayati TaxID=131215 RepID=A0ACC2NRF2_9HYME|nr:hypothetical protein QAD02_005101 [Eretmocerus hayati]
MPFFTVELFDGSRSAMVKAETFAEIITNSLEDMELDSSGQYSLFLEDRKTKVKDSIIEYANSTQSMVRLMIKTIQEDNAPSSRINTTSNDPPVEIAHQSAPQNIDAFSLSHLSELLAPIRDEYKHIIDSMESGEILEFQEMRVVVIRCANYMRDVRKDVTRGFATKISTALCKKYAQTFADRIEGQHWGDGIATLRLSIMNVHQYRKNTPSKKRPRVYQDSDEEAASTEESEGGASRGQDGYGCTEYAPAIPDSETPDSQEEKRLRLAELFQNSTSPETDEVSNLMSETYATQRALMNSKQRNLNKLFKDWPYLGIASIFIAHSHKLLGKDVNAIFQESLKNKAGIIRQYLKNCPIMKKKPEQLTAISRESKDASVTFRSKLPETLIIFKLVPLYFDENSAFFKIVAKNLTTEDILDRSNGYPTLVIRGSSLYDDEAICSVVLERSSIVPCKDVLEGTIVTFMAYYVFGYSYPSGLERTLEFIQRYLFAIVPPNGSEFANKKKRNANDVPFDAKVRKLAKALAEYSSYFKT